MDATTMTPAQQAALTGLIDLGGARPTFDPDLPGRLLSSLEQSLDPVADRLGAAGVELFLSKRSLAHVHQCERYVVEGEPVSFAWSVATAKGTVAHGAIERSAFLPPGTTPRELVEATIDSLVADGGDRSPRQFLLDAPPGDLASLRAEATEIITKFQECFPPLDARWRPRTESLIYVELCAARIVLQAKVDLALGRARGLEARTLLVDFKTGRHYPAHLDDLRFYALLETLRVGTPPYRVASYYLDAARWCAEDVSEELLHITVRRVVDGVTKLAELKLGERTPSFAPGPMCNWCAAARSCPGPSQLLNEDR